MSAATPHSHLDTAIAVAREREDVIVGGEIVRHRRSSRLIHWTVAVTFFVSLLTGMPIWSPVFGWMAGLFGGLSVCRVLHPWAGIAFSLASVVMFFHWLAEMRLEPRDKEWFGPRALQYMRYETDASGETRVAFDEPGPTLRHETYKAYKAQRPPMPEGMSGQIPYIHRIVEAMNIPAVKLVGYEADDLIGTLACQAERAGYDVVIVTGDKDMFQLLAPHIRIYDPVKSKWFGEAECRARFGVEPARVVEVMGLMGDSTDNIPGVRGIGEKTAIKLITEFGTIDELFAHWILGRTASAAHRRWSILDDVLHWGK